MGLLSSETIEIECDIDLERSEDSFHAYAIPRVDIRPGDTLVLHDMPDRLHFGECRQFRARATLTRAGTLKRLWTEAAGIFELTGLYEVGFQPDEELALRPRETA
jgi:hypothetical protein